MAKVDSLPVPGPPRAKTLVLDLLSTLRSGSMPVRALVGAGALFGLEDNGVRVALARLLAQGLVERDERGRYRLGAAAGAIERQVTSWRRLEERLRPWTGSWIVAHGAPRERGERGLRRRGARALRFVGFRALAPGLALRPDNLAGGVPAARETLRGLGLDTAVLIFGARDLEPCVEARARSLWDVRSLEAGYHAACRALARSEARLARLTPSAAMVESFRVGGYAIRQLALDPLLPDEICPAAPRDALVAAMRRYDRLGRAAWAGFRAEHGVRTTRGAQDLRMMEAADTLAAVGGDA